VYFLGAVDFWPEAYGHCATLQFYSVPINLTISQSNCPEGELSGDARATPKIRYIQKPVHFARRAIYIFRLNVTCRPNVMTISRTPLLIGIAGGTGSGKSTLAADLLQRFAREGSCLLEQDSYYRDRSYLSAAEREGVNYDEPEAIEHDLLLEQVKSLMAGKAIEKPVYCFKTHSRSREVQLVNPSRVIIVEGLFALWDSRVRLLMDLKIYVDAAADLRFLRRARRDMSERGRTINSVIEQYLGTVRPMHELHIEPAKAHADLVVENNGDIKEMLKIARAVADQASKRSDYEE
jgi:uridine kinase